ncbi:hypothetical protein VE03_04901 [Pseudogymnoascus sp. 23342-1-I1]|nr:hypothetical protein VE03_04901 [Pseudogymnoascus sp. 23342-1-I1]
MHIPTPFLLSLSALLTTVLASPLVERACAYDDCTACEDFCWNEIREEVLMATY